MRKMTLLFLISYKTSQTEHLCDLASILKIQLVSNDYKY